MFIAWAHRVNNLEIVVESKYLLNNYINEAVWLSGEIYMYIYFLLVCC